MEGEMRTQRVTQTFRHGRQGREEDAGDIAVPAAVLATLHAAQADEVLADHAGERIPGAVGARIEVGQDDLARRLRRGQDMLGQQPACNTLSGHSRRIATRVFLQL